MPHFRPWPTLFSTPSEGRRSWFRHGNETDALWTRTWPLMARVILPTMLLLGMGGPMAAAAEMRKIGSLATDRSREIEMLSRRHFCCAGVLAGTAASFGKAFPQISARRRPNARQAALSPDDALAELKAGNERFLTQNMRNCDLLGQVRATAGGQFPFALVIGCIDSRVPPNWCSINASAISSAPASPATSPTMTSSAVPNSRLSWLGQS